MEGSIINVGPEAKKRVRSSRVHDTKRRSTMHKKTKNEAGNATRASVSEEMAKPRMTKSARIANLLSLA